MKREDLKAKGLTDEQIDFVMAENGKDINTSKSAAEKAAQDLTAAQEQAKGLQAQIDARDKDIKDLQEKAKGNEGISDQLAQLQAKYTKDTQDLQKRLDDQRADFAMEKAFANVPFASTLAKKAAIADFKAKGYKVNEKGEYAEAEMFIASLKKEDPAAFKPDDSGKDKGDGKDGGQGNGQGQNGNGGKPIANGNAWVGADGGNGAAGLPRFTGQMTNNQNGGNAGSGAGANNGNGGQQNGPNTNGFAFNFVRDPNGK